MDEEDKVELIFVEGIDETNEGLAVMNRLSKAAMEVVNGGGIEWCTQIV